MPTQAWGMGSASSAVFSSGPRVNHAESTKTADRTAKSAQRPPRTTRATPTLVGVRPCVRGSRDISALEGEAASWSGFAEAVKPAYRSDRSRDLPAQSAECNRVDQTSDADRRQLDTKKHAGQADPRANIQRIVEAELQAQTKEAPTQACPAPTFGKNGSTKSPPSQDRRSQTAERMSTHR